MKKMMTFTLAAFMAACAFAEIKEVAADTDYVPMSAEDEGLASRFRISGGAVGRFGLEGRAAAFGDFPGAKEHAHLYGMGLDVQFNLLPAEKFNLWLGLGGRYMPEQELMDYSQTWSDSFSTMTYKGKVDIEAYDLRVMLIPEWAITPSVALGVRAGIGFTHYRGKLTETSTVNVPSIAVSTSSSSAVSFSDTQFQGILGLQATWMLTDHIGIYAYGDGIIGGDADFTVNGEKAGSLDSTAFEAGLGVTITF